MNKQLLTHPNKRKFTITQTTTIGKFGENIALKYLLARGYTHVQSNYHIQGGELDLVMAKNGIIIFVEVKLRTSNNFGLGSEAITNSKKRKLLRSIFTFMQSPNRPTSLHQWQLDLVAIHYQKSSNTAFVQHFPNILEA